MTSSRTVRDQLRPVPVRLRPQARRRALVAGLATGPLSTAGFGFSFVGIPQLFAGAAPTSWIFTGIGIASLVLAVVVGTGLMRPHHRGTRAALQAIVLVGLPLALLATGIITNVILTLALAAGTSSAPEPWLVFLLSWLSVAAPGVILGPFAMWWTAHLNRFLPSELVTDEAIVARYEATTTTS